LIAQIAAQTTNTGATTDKDASATAAQHTRNSSKAVSARAVAARKPPEMVRVAKLHWYAIGTGKESKRDLMVKNTAVQIPAAKIRDS